MSRSTLHVTNEFQKLHFINELQGQISDGNWENSRPHGHWQVWCSLKWGDIVVEENYGRTFYAEKSNYNFSNKMLMEVVGERMIFAAKLFKLNPSLFGFDWDGNQIPDDVEDYEWHHEQEVKARARYTTARDECLFPAVDNVGATESRLNELFAIKNHTDQLTELAALVGDVARAKEYASARRSFEYAWGWMDRIAGRGITKEMLQAATDSDCYTLKDLRKDMSLLKKAAKHSRVEGHPVQPKPRKSAVKKVAAKTEPVFEMRLHLRKFYTFRTSAYALQLLKLAAPKEFLDLVGDATQEPKPRFKFSKGYAEFSSVKLANYILGAGGKVMLVSGDTNGRWEVIQGTPVILVIRSQIEPITEFTQ